VVDRDAKEAVNLRRVQVEREDAVGAGGDQEVGHEARGDGDPGLVLLVRAHVGEVREHDGDAPRPGAAQGVDEDQRLHQGLVDRRTRGLDDEHVAVAHVLLDAHLEVLVGEAVEAHRHERHAQVGGDGLREARVRGACDEDGFAMEEHR
jgi:hypothetical protein